MHNFVCACALFLSKTLGANNSTPTTIIWLVLEPIALWSDRCDRRNRLHKLLKELLELDTFDQWDFPERRPLKLYSTGQHKIWNRLFFIALDFVQAWCFLEDPMSDMVTNVSQIMKTPTQFGTQLHETTCLLNSQRYYARTFSSQCQNTKERTLREEGKINESKHFARPKYTGLIMAHVVHLAWSYCQMLSVSLVDSAFHPCRRSCVTGHKSIAIALMSCFLPSIVINYFILNKTNRPPVNCINDSIFSKLGESDAM